MKEVSWLVETTGGETFLVQDLLKWCDTYGFNTYQFYRTYDKSDFTQTIGKRFYKEHRLVRKQG